MNNAFENYIEDYLETQAVALDELPTGKIQDAAEILNEARLDEKQIFVVGNGGSASNASHFAQDMTKGASDALEVHGFDGDGAIGFRCVSLTDNVSWITAIGNDNCYEGIFVDQLSKLARSGDVLVAISVSGTSENVVRAAKFMLNIDGRVISLVGKRKNPRKKPHLKDHSTCVVEICDSHFGRVEDLQMTVLHALAYYFQDNAGDFE